MPVLGEGLTPASAHGVTLAVELLQPDSRGHIRLASADPAEQPIIDPGYLTAEADLLGLVAGLRIAEQVCDTAALRPYVGAPMAPWPGHVDDPTLATFIREHAQTAFHPVGTCRMGTDDTAVVDPELRVHGLDGLRVVDASVMPRIIRGHTHAPTVMIAERAADLIRASQQTVNPRTSGTLKAGRRQRFVRRQAATRPMAKLYSVVQQPIDELTYRLSGGRTTASEWLSGLEIAMLTTTGARTGVPRTVPVLPLPDGDRIILIASNFGRPHHPSWYHNLRANPCATIVLGGVTREVVAHELHGAEREACYRRGEEVYPGFSSYRRWATP